MTRTEEISALHKQYVMPTYAPELALVRGEGAVVWDADGNQYLDFLAGIAVCNAGHCHPKLVAAIRQQAGTLMHVSNLYYNEWQPRLARALSERALGGKVFFCNSGAEANEGLIKLARKWGHDQGRYEIITMKQSFHGRTLATLTATGQDKVKKDFDPLPEGFCFAEFNRLESVAEAINKRTAAVLVEAVQGEGGIIPADPAFLTGLEALCRETGILFFFDEVQCGMGRTGKWFGYQHYDVHPDAISLAKGLGGGFPMGAVIASPALSDVFQPGSHATTFGGTPLACAAASAVIEIIEEEDLLENTARLGKQFSEGLELGLVLDRPAADLQKAAQRQGLICLATAVNVLRFLPPLNIDEDQVAQALDMLAAACMDIA